MGRSSPTSIPVIKGGEINEIEPAMLQDNFPTNSTSSSSSSASSSTPSISTKTSTTSTTSTTLTLPPGWVAPKRETGFYAVPVIIATSVILATVVIAAIAGSVIWRKKATGKKGKGDLGEIEKTLGGGGGKRRKFGRQKKGEEGEKGEARSSAVSSGGRRGGRRRRGGGEEEDEGTALTGSVKGRRVETFTERLTGRFRRGGGKSMEKRSNWIQSRGSTINEGRSRPSSIAGTSRSLVSQQNDLSPTASRLSQSSQLRPRSLHSPSSSRLSLPQQRQEDLGQPSDAPTSILPSSLQSEIDVLLPVLGPPAYRPSGSFIQQTTRLTRSLLPPSSTLPIPGDDDWYWPGEKTRPLQPSPSLVEDLSEESPITEEEEEEEVETRDPEAFRAHLATDDKSVLNRLRELALASSSGSSSAMERVEATAPSAEEEEEEQMLPSPSTSRTISSSTSLLPEPPKPISYSIASTSKARLAAELAAKDNDLDVDEEGFLPIYKPPIRSGLEDATAPPPEDEDYEEDEEEELEYSGEDRDEDEETEREEERMVTTLGVREEEGPG